MTIGDSNCNNLIDVYHKLHSKKKNGVLIVTV